MGQLVSDLRFAARLLFKSRLTSAAAILSFALGIAGTTAIFSVVDAVLLRPLPYEDPESLVMVRATSRFGSGYLSPADFIDYRREIRSVEGLAAVMASPMSLTGDGDPEQVRVQSVSGNFFTVLGVRGLAGRTFVPDDDAPDAAEQVVLAEGLWKKRYGGNLDIVGRQVTLADRRVEVVGIVPSSFRFDSIADVWLLGQRGIPRVSSVPGDLSTNRDVHILTVIGRLRSGVRIQAAQSEFDAAAAQLARMYPNWNTGVGVKLDSLQAALVGDTRIVLLTLLGAVGLLLMIASVNVANLLLVRLQQRVQELVLRTALGASRARLIAQVLLESLVLAVPGGALGVCAAIVAIGILVRIAPSDLPRVADMALNLHVLGFATGITVLTGVALGTWPAWRASETSASAAMNAAARGLVGRERRRAQHVLVAGQLAIALVLLVGAGLLITSFAKLVTIETGFDSRNVVAVDVSLPGGRYAADPDRKARFHETVLHNLQGQPGIEGAAMSLRPPMSPAINRGVWIEGQPEPRPGEPHGMSFFPVSDDYFDILRIPLRSGRTFTSQDRARTQGVAIINEAFARRYLAGQDPLSRRIGFGSRSAPGYWRLIVGIVGDTRERPVGPPVPTAYIPFRQDLEPWSFGSYLVKSRLPTTTVGEAVRRAVLGADPDQPISRVRTVEETMATSIAVQRFTTVLATVFAVLALLLASVGTFGVMSHVVSTRTREIGVRLALGAERSDIVRLVLGQAARLAAGAAVTGLGVAVLVGGSLRALLFGVTPEDPRLLAAAVIVLLTAALAASYMPVRRALMENPMANLQHD
jgi:putative ABC transport system permease protein